MCLFSLIFKMRGITIDFDPFCSWSYQGLKSQFCLPLKIFSPLSDPFLFSRPPSPCSTSSSNPSLFLLPPIFFYFKKERVTKSQFQYRATIIFFRFWIPQQNHDFVVSEQRIQQNHSFVLFVYHNGIKILLFNYYFLSQWNHNSKVMWKDNFGRQKRVSPLIGVKSNSNGINNNSPWFYKKNI